MAETLEKAVRQLYAVNLGVKRGERVIIFADTIMSWEEIGKDDQQRRERLPDLARRVADIGKTVCEDIRFITYPSLQGHGLEPPGEIWAAAFGRNAVKRLEDAGLLKKVINKEDLSKEETADIVSILESNRSDAADVIIALANFSTSHTKFRYLFTDVCKKRYASMPLFDEAMFYGPMQVDWEALKHRTNSLALFMDGSDKVLVTAPNGTALALGVEGRKQLVDDGDLTAPGAFGNLPAGEVFVAPVEGTTEGILVIEWAPTAKLASPIMVTIERGLVKDITGKDPYAKKLESKMSERPDFRNIAELGIGTNDMAKRADNILESEKIMGTVHIAFGDNSTFGGRVNTPFHQDYVLFNPTVKIKRKKEEATILENGSLKTFVFQSVN